MAGTYDIDIDPDKDNLNSVIQKISAADGDMTGGKLQASIAMDNSIKSPPKLAIPSHLLRIHPTSLWLRDLTPTSQEQERATFSFPA
ncbi:MAG: hypothetical protein LRY51_03835 [Geovibrio sp.]|nr:hypothetical protein [Geovibrio sp.]